MMRRLEGMSIRNHLILLVMIAIVPTVLIICYTAAEHRRNAAEEAEQRALHLVDDLAVSQNLLIAGTRQMLGVLAEYPEVKSGDVAGCNRVFARLLARYSQYNSIQAATVDGRLFASGKPLPGTISVADRKYFRDALRTGEFAAGEYIVGRTANRPMFNYAQPVFGDSGRITAVLQAGIDLELLHRNFSRVALPQGTTVTVSDHAGTILYRSGAGANATGGADDPVLFRLMQQGGERGKLHPPSGARSAPLMVFGTVSLAPAAPPHLFIRVTMPAATHSGAQSVELVRNLILILIIVFLALLASRLLGRRCIVLPVEQLAAAVRRFGSGDVAARSGLPYRDNEIGALARAFDDLAEVLVIRLKERDSQEESLRWITRQALEEKAKSAAVISAIGHGLSIQDREFRVIYQNEAHIAMMGDQKGRFCYEAYENAPQVCDSCPVAMAFADGQPHTVERSVLHPGGTMLHVEITASVVRDADGQIASGLELVRDITPWREMETEVLAVNEALKLSNRDLQHFVYVASHDLKEPLRTITSFIQLLEQRYREKLDDKASMFIGFIVEGAARMQTLIDDLLLYSRVESKGKALAPVDSGALVRMALENLAVALDESGATVTAGELPLVLGDEVQLIQLFQNLVGNAVKFRGEAAPVVTITAVRERGMWRFAVADNGIGIESHCFERIFDIFQKLHPRDQYEGTGIGLAICKKIVERHGGRIWVESSPGSGSVFHFTLKGVQP
jgi:signal transduction histidine kinase